MKRLILISLLVVLCVSLATGCDIISDLINPPPPEEPQPTGVLFFDDFEGRADPAWWTDPNSKDRWIVKQGRYTIDGNSPEDIPMRTFVGSSSWQNYSVEMDVFNCSYKSQQVAIFLRVQNEGDMVGFFISADRWSNYAWFKIKKDGVWQDIGRKGYAPRYHYISNFHLLITVNDNTYSAFANAKLITTVEIPDFPTRGYVGLQTANWGGTLTSFDNFKVTSLGD